MLYFPILSITLSYSPSPLLIFLLLKILVLFYFCFSLISKVSTIPVLIFPFLLLLLQQNVRVIATNIKQTAGAAMSPLHNSMVSLHPEYSVYF